MSDFYCHECSMNSGLMPFSVPENLTGTKYAYDHFIKHTNPTANYRINSVFDNPSYENYRGYTMSGSASGFIEVDSWGRRNVIYYAGERVGETRASGYKRPDSAVKIVCFDDPLSDLHTFPTASDAFISARCSGCGKPIVP